MNLPPASRPSLGKGPTGKDRPRIDAHSYMSARSRESSSVDMDSPSSTRANSISPSAMTSLRHSPRSAQALDSGATWDQSLLMGEPPADGQGGSTSYSVAPVSTSVPQKDIQHYSFSTSIHPNPRNSMGSTLYLGSQQSQYSSNTDRSMAGTYNSAGYLSRDVRGEHHFPYSPTQFSNHDSSIQSHSPTTSMSHHSQHSRDSISSHPNPSYPQRRSHTEPQSFRPPLSHTPNPIHLDNTVKMSLSPRPPDSAPSFHRPPPPYSGSDGRSSLSSIP